MNKTRVLFVCTGNICRSPTAEGVFRTLVERAGLGAAVEVDSAGTHGYHVGEVPDRRSQQAALRRGYDLSAQRARQVMPDDFVRYDRILAMDRKNLSALMAFCPPVHWSKVELFLSYAEGVTLSEVPDPYYGEGDGFERVLDLIEAASAGLLRCLREDREQPRTGAAGGTY